MNIRVTHQRDQGRVRQRQEDNCFSYVDNEKAILVLSDGMGGHAGGDLASMVSVDAAMVVLRAWPDLSGELGGELEPAADHSTSDIPSASDTNSASQQTIDADADMRIVSDEKDGSDGGSEILAESGDVVAPEFTVTLAEWVKSPDGANGNSSRTSIQSVVEIPQHTQVSDAIEGVFTKAQGAVCDIALNIDESLGNAGCTLTTALIVNGWLHIGHIGDSRAYLYRQGKLEQLTLDHSGAMLLVAAGLIPLEAARYHPESHSLYRFLGISAVDLTVDVHHEKLQQGDIVMLCSDGLWGMVEDSTMVELFNNFAATLPIASSPNIRLVHGDLNKVADALIQKANEMGGEDNISVALAMI